MVISHPHDDHMEGAFSVIQSLKVKQVVLGKNLEDNSSVQRLIALCHDKGIEVQLVSQNDYFMLDGIGFEVLYPHEKVHDQNLNNLSLLVKMTYGNISVLFTGDLEDEVENLGRYAENVDILKVGHHGSDTSTSISLLNKATPQIALISVGKRNGYGHPKKEVLERLVKFHTQVYRTDQMGEVHLVITKDKVKVSSKLKNNEI